MHRFTIALAVIAVFALLALPVYAGTSTDTPSGKVLLAQASSSSGGTSSGTTGQPSGHKGMTSGQGMKGSEQGKAGTEKSMTGTKHHKKHPGTVSKGAKAGAGPHYKHMKHRRHRMPRAGMDLGWLSLVGASLAGTALYIRRKRA